MTFSSVLRRVGSCIYLIFNRYRFRYVGYRVRLFSPLKINGAGNIYIADRVTIEYKTWLAAVPLSGKGDCLLEIGEGSTIGHFNHIYCTESVKIGKNVLTADKVYISDNLHGYEDVTIPVKNQPIKQLCAVEIGDGSWLGENVCVIGAKIGKGCVIGANAVVTKDIPDYSVAVGMPAKVIKHYNIETKRWERVG